MIKSKINPQVDTYLSAGCGRCALTNTPECKVHNWTKELEALREIVLGCGLTEELKWGQPVYTLENNNVILITAFKENCVISFLKGALLKDVNGILSKQGENVQSARVVRFTDVQQIVNLESVIKEYIYEAIKVEKAGLKVELKDVSAYPIPEELQNKLDKNEAFKNAFFALTPGRQKGYLLHFSQPKQSKTRSERIEKCMPQIIIGKGLHD
ncbi:MAG TPA: YdeI/OmpD-associated family protein [Pyrinomonadaceae bacterium]|nr:YdeI/OmpD-associated family protein [Pyrinomonadaceae bacterium]